MYFALTGAMKNRVVSELRRYWVSHPKYRDIVDHIQGKYSFRERPSYGIIVKVSGGTRVDMSADNFKGVVVSYVYLMGVQNFPGTAIEWVREDAVAIQNNNGNFPSPAGIYYVELTDTNVFYVHPMLDVRDELPTKVTDTEYQLQNLPLAGSLRLYEGPAGYELQEDINYTVDNATGVITLTNALTGSRYLISDYRYAGTSTGPHNFVENYANNRAIPGVVLAFGNRNEKGDRMAVVVQGIRQPAALEYGGRWQINMECEVCARDVHAEAEIYDQTIIYLQSSLRPKLSSEGIEMGDISMGGESEEIWDENGEDYYFNANFSLTLETEWAVHIPLPYTLRRTAALTGEQARWIAGLTDDEVVSATNNIVMLENMGLQSIQDPYFRDRSKTYERIR